MLMSLPSLFGRFHNSSVLLSLLKIMFTIQLSIGQIYQMQHLLSLGEKKNWSNMFLSRTSWPLTIQAWQGSKWFTLACLDPSVNFFNLVFKLKMDFCMKKGYKLYLFCKNAHFHKHKHAPFTLEKLRAQRLRAYSFTRRLNSYICLFTQFYRTLELSSLNLNIFCCC